MKPNAHSTTTESIQCAPPSTKIDAKSQAVSLFFSDMLSLVQEDFQHTGDSIMYRMRRMSSKMDGLEQSISDLMHNSGLEEEDEEHSKKSNITSTALASHSVSHKIQLK